MKKKIAKSMFMVTGALSFSSMLLTILSALVLVIEAIVRSCSLLSVFSLVPWLGWAFISVVTAVPFTMVIGLITDTWNTKHDNFY